MRNSNIMHQEERNNGEFGKGMVSMRYHHAWPVVRINLLVIVFSLLSCGVPPENTVEIKMVDWPEFIESISESEGFRMGEPGHERYIGSGWDIVEQDQDGRFFRWAIGDTIDLIIPITSPRDISITMKWAPPPLGPGQYQGFIALFNGREIDRGVISSHRFTEQEIDVPEQLVQIGYNHFRIIPSRKAILDHDTRSLRFCVREIHWNQSPSNQLTGDERRRIKTLRERTDQLGMIHVANFNAVYIPVYLAAGSEIRGTAHHLAAKGGKPVIFNIFGRSDHDGDIQLFSEEITPAQRSMDFVVPVSSSITGVSLISDTNEPDGLGISNLIFRRPGIPALSRSILLITIDGLRAEDIENESFPAPTIRKIRDMGLWCSCAITPALGFQPFYSSVLSGHYPHIHHVYNDELTLSSAAPTVATELNAEGYYCIASVADPRLSPSRISLDRGFHVFSSRSDMPLTAFEVSQRAIEAVFSAKNTEKPYFIWAQFSDVAHDLELPNNMIESYEGYVETDDPLIAARRTRYIASVNYVDQEILRLLDAFETLGGADSISIFITSDQGFQFSEFEGCSFFHQSRIRVPLIISVPDIIPPATGISAPVSLIDLFNVVKRISSTDTELNNDTNIVRLLGDSRERYGQVYCETENDDSYVIFEWPYKLIRIGDDFSPADSSGIYCLYDLRDDISETAELSLQESARIQEIVRKRDESINATTVRYRPGVIR